MAGSKRRFLVRSFILLFIGLVPACLSAWGSAYFLAEPTMAYPCDFHEYPDTWNNPKRLRWLRVWRAPYGTDVQIALLGRIPEDGQSPAPERGSLPLWTQARATWPARPAACDEAAARGHMWMEVASGWPLPCFSSAYMASMGNGSAIPGTVQGGVAITKYQLPPPPPPPPFPLQHPAVLPLRPWAPGLAVDALFYALVFAAIRFTIRRLRTRFRVRRGRCPACGYDLRASPEQCPECGRPVALGRASPAP